MKRLIICSFLLSAFFIQAQEPDAAFLDSLPDDVREDLLKRTEEQTKSAEENYKPSQYSSKLQQAEELIDLKTRIEADLKELQKRLQGDERLEISPELKLFGSDFFSTFQTSFMPINEPNPDSSYTLGVGDILNIQIIGQKDFIEDFPVNGDGAINFPDIGEIVLVGLTLSEASQIIKSKVNSAYIGTEAFISLSRLKDVNVLIAGDAENPGIYTLSGNSNILQAISVSGGISEYGSYREINLIRDNKIIEVLDVYDLLINGNYNLIERLRSGDVIFINPRKSIVTIDGAVKRPAKYELTEEQNLSDIIKYANGFKQTADIQNIYLERILDGSLKSIPITNKVQFASIKSIDGDLVYIREFPYRKATISGAVLKPGSYVMAAGETLDDLIIKAGGYTDNAYPFGAIFQNRDAKEINKKAQSLLYQEFLDNIIALSQQNISGNFDLTPMVNLTKEISDSEANGRIVVDIENEESRKTLGIQEGDSLIIPEKTNNVYVYGEVSTEGSVMYVPNRSVDFFIEKSGGYKKYADNESIYILHPNGETDRYSKRRNIFESQPRSGVIVYPGSIIFVPKELDNSASRALAAQAYVTILGNLGLALASLNSISTDWSQWKMLSKKKGIHIKNFSLVLIFFSLTTFADSFNYNIYNNHGVVGLINMPTARFYNEGIHGVSIYDSDTVQKITLSSNPYDWLEASFFYMNLPEVRICRAYYNIETFCEGFKDKGFNFKVRLKEEGIFPAIAVGLMDFAGTGKYSGEYIVSSYGINKIDMHLGLGWGKLSGSSKQIDNPLGHIRDSFNERPEGYSGQGGTFNPGTYFSGKAAPFYGISYSINEKTLLKFEKDTLLVKDVPWHRIRESDYSFGLDYSMNSNFSLGISFERGGVSSLKFVYKNNPKKSIKKYEYKKAEVNPDDNKYNKLIKNLEENGIGVNKISETANSIGLELTQFIHPDLRIVEEIIVKASKDAGINKNIKKDLKIADLKAISEIDDVFERSASTIYNRGTARRINTSTNVRFRPFIASREEFFKGALLAENDTEFILRENLFFSTNLKYSLANNFDDLVFPPQNTFPAQVRSDVKQYLKNMDDGILIGRAQLDYHITPKINHHLMFTGGILEDMFSGFGAEYLYFEPNTNYSFGVELFKVQKRDYHWGLGHLDYKNTTITGNFYYRNYGRIPFDMKLSAGEYLAGDVGSTIEFSRTFDTGVRFGVFATFTDVSNEEFGEGSFDKGLFFNVPIYGNLINYTWRPLTKDPGARLIRKNTLNDLLVRFRPID